MIQLRINSAEETNSVRQNANGTFTLDGRTVQARVERLSDYSVQLVAGNRTHTVTLLGFDASKNQLRLKVGHKTTTVEVSTLEDRMLEIIGLDRAAMLKVSDVKAPMPGLVRRILVKPGDSVQPGDALLVLEAMKMENVLKSPTAGVVAEVRVQENAPVDKNAVLIAFA